MLLVKLHICYGFHVMVLNTLDHKLHTYDAKTQVKLFYVSTRYIFAGPITHVHMYVFPQNVFP